MHNLQILSLSNYTYVIADYSSYFDTIVDLYMQAYELIRSVLNCRILYWICTIFLAEDPRPPPFSIQLCQIKYY